ncbi:MAG: chorismate-binding protein [Actinomycetaceae bacterium]|nr:chorismate-binding protein [Actinomycetaceae bacterium]
MSTFTQLHVSSIPLPKRPDLRALLTAIRGQIAWIKNGEGFVAVGQAARIDIPNMTNATPEERFEQAARWWKNLVEQAEVDDAVHVPGSGLTTFGSFSFMPHSPAGSTLIVPEVIVGISEGVPFLTTITGATEADGASQTDRAAPADGISPADMAASASQRDAATYTKNVAVRKLRDALANNPVFPDNTSKAETFYGDFGTVRVDAALSLNEYRAVVDNAREQIAQGTVSKVVVARDLDITTEKPIDERTLITRLNAAYPDCWTFAVDGLIGATPELLASSDAGVVTSRVLAGTLPREAHTDPQTLVDSAKDQDEHAHAVDSVVEVLQGHGETYADATPYVYELPNLFHLASDVRTELDREVNTFDVLGALHPTAALGGTPRPKALEIIDRIERIDRDRYGAPVGWMGADNTGQWCVSLRCARIIDDFHARAWAGGGIMHDSDADAEYAETMAKFAPILGAFGAN